jgi:glucose/arabinose dehydrogenase
VEELNLIEAGRHYGWPVREGPYLFDPDGNTDVVYELPPDDEGYTYPVAMYDHEEGFAIAGGFVYRNARIAELEGMFLASDIRSGDLFMVPADALEQGEVTPFRHWFMRDENGLVDPYAMVGGRSRTDLRIGTDHFGEIYVLTKQDGRVRKLISPDEPRTGYGLFEGYPWTENWIDAAGFLGWSYVAHYPWVYLQRLGKFIHAAPAQEPGGWVFVPR